MKKSIFSILLLTISLNSSYIDLYNKAIGYDDDKNYKAAEEFYIKSIIEYDKNASNKKVNGSIIYNAHGWNQVLQLKFNSNTMKLFNDAIAENNASMSHSTRSQILANIGFTHWMNKGYNKSKKSFEGAIKYNKSNELALEYLLKGYIHKFKNNLKKTEFKDELLYKLKGTKDSKLSKWFEAREYLNVGIADLIWCAKDYEKESSFFAFVANLDTNVTVKPFLKRLKCPWDDITIFYDVNSTKERNELNNFLNITIEQQFESMTNDFINALPIIVNSSKDRYSTLKKIEKLLFNDANITLAAHGTFSLMDYRSFKGNGTKVRKCTNDKGEKKEQEFGLLHVLDAIDTNSSDIYMSFYKETSKALQERVIQNCNNDSIHKKNWKDHTEEYDYTKKD